MAVKSVALLPCAVFFEANRFVYGVTALLMQLSLVFWPVAVSWARQFNGENGVNRLLAEFADLHRVHQDPYAATAKKFRQAA